MQRGVWPLALLLVVVLTGSASSSPVVPGDHDVPLVVGDRTRHYLLHVPSVPAGHAPMPVLVALHGGGSSAARFKRYARLDRLADQEGVVVAYPEGSGPFLRSWNAGDCCGYAKQRGIDDVGFIASVLQDLARRLPIDRTRVYVTGYSNGAMMAHRVAAEMPERIAAIAAVAGVLAMDHFAPSRPVPVLHIHSVDDSRELYGDESGPPFPITSASAHDHPVEFELARWVDRDECRAEAQVAEHRARPAKDGRPAQTATRLVYTPCMTAAEVQLWRLTGVGHVWPGANTQIQRLQGPDTDLIGAAEEMWKFLARFARPDAPSL